MKPAMTDAQLPSFPFSAVPPMVRRYVEANAASLHVDPNALAMAYLASASGVPPPGVALQVGAEVIEPRLWVLMVAAESASVSLGDLAEITEHCIDTLEKVESTSGRHAAQRWLAWSAAGGERPIPSRQLSHGDALGEAPITGFLARADGGLVVRFEFVDWLRASLRAEQAIPGVRMFGPLDPQARAAALIAVLEQGEQAEFCALASKGAAACLLPVFVRSLGKLEGVLSPETTRLLAMSDSPLWTEHDEILRNSWASSDALLRELAQLPPCRLELDPLARAVLDEFAVRARRLGQAHGASGLGACLTALSCTIGSLTLLLHLLTYGREARNLTVDAEAAEAAVRILETFVIPHARAVYGDAAL
jgi:hypothetical protein